MPHIHRFAVRSSGRDLTLVRRPLRNAPITARVVVEPVDPAPVLKADVVALAEARGVDSSGTKADILARLGSVE